MKRPKKFIGLVLALLLAMQSVQLVYAQQGVSSGQAGSLYQAEGVEEPDEFPVFGSKEHQLLIAEISELLLLNRDCESALNAIVDRFNEESAVGFSAEFNYRSSVESVQSALFYIFARGIVRQNDLRRGAEDHVITTIRGLGAGCVADIHQGISRDTFLVGFASEDDFYLIDYLLAFTGLPRHMVEYVVAPPRYTWEEIDAIIERILLFLDTHRARYGNGVVNILAYPENVGDRFMVSFYAGHDYKERYFDVFLEFTGLRAEDVHSTVWDPFDGWVSLGFVESPIEVTLTEEIERNMEEYAIPVVNAFGSVIETIAPRMGLRQTERVLVTFAVGLIATPSAIKILLFHLSAAQ